MRELDAPVSVGDLLDRITILTIKDANIKEFDPSELTVLQQIADQLELPKSVLHLQQILLSVNEEIWGVEDFNRDCERNKKFDQDFIENARSVYILNDTRAQIKKTINQLSDSEIVEVKSHEDYL